MIHNYTHLPVNFTVLWRTAIATLNIPFEPFIATSIGHVWHENAAALIEPTDVYVYDEPTKLKR